MYLDKVAQKSASFQAVLSATQFSAYSFPGNKNQDALFNKMASCEPMEIVQTF